MAGIWEEGGGGLITSHPPAIFVKGEFLVPYLWGYWLGWVGKRLSSPVLGGQVATLYLWLQMWPPGSGLTLPFPKDLR